MNYPFTLHEDDDAKVVQLAGTYDVNWGCSLSEVKAVFYPAGQVRLYHFSNDDGLKTMEFSMNGQEMDAFFSAWETFKVEQELKKLTEQKRIADIAEQAHKLIEGLPITIMHHPKTEGDSCEWWDITCQKPAIDRRAYNVQDLLGYTQNSVERYQAVKAIHDEIQAIKEACPAIRIKGEQGQTFHVSIPEPDIYGEWVHSPEQLLERVKAAKVKYEEWQAEQERLKKVLMEVERLTKQYPAVTTEQEMHLDTEKPFWYIRTSNGPVEVAYTLDELLLKVHKAAEQFIERQDELIKSND